MTERTITKEQVEELLTPEPTQGEWVIGYGNGITGSTCPRCNGATVGETTGFRTSQIITVADIDDLGHPLNSVIAILPLRSGKAEQDANARLIVNAKKMLDALKFVRKCLYIGLEKGYTVHDMLHAVGWTEGKQYTVMGTLDTVIAKVEDHE